MLLHLFVSRPHGKFQVIQVFYGSPTTSDYFTIFCIVLYCMYALYTNKLFTGPSIQIF